MHSGFTYCFAHFIKEMGSFVLLENVIQGLAFYTEQ